MDNEQIIQDIKLGLSYIEIGKKYGYSREWIRQIANKNGRPSKKRTKISEISIYKFIDQVNKSRKQHPEIFGENTPEYTIHDYLHSLELKISKKRYIMKRDGNKCRYCGISAMEGVEMTIDHVIPKSKGGNHSVYNLVLACSRCNLRKGVKPLNKEEYESIYISNKEKART